MTTTTPPGGTFTMADDLEVTRMGYGAMQLAGPGVWGPPQDRETALAVVRRLRDALPPHSYVVISHGTAERMPRDVFEQLVRLYRSTSQPVSIRSRVEIEPFFEGVELVEPGLVYVPLWRPEEKGDLLLDRPEVSGGFAAIGRRA